ncbi:BCCT family transporter [Vibrio bathopelagicus]|uniref:BCCT family transporter n=1 Tax=Vibrio bathopelagicus TaxID=2777577 RepID=UPI001864B5D6|nr:BCCT family transporter [Vibrio bathopelagicus]
MTSVPKNTHKLLVSAGAGLILTLCFVYVLLAPEASTDMFSNLKNYIAHKFAWFYMASVALFISILIFSACSRVGDLRLGKDNERPEFSGFAWGSMLFSTGMGIGLVFFGVAEPVMHYMNPPIVEAQSDVAVRDAMNITFFHWGINAWAIYTIVALVISYAAYRKGRPLEMRSAFYPIFGERINGPLGVAIDVFAVLATVVGIVTPLGFGVQQINAGLNYVLGVEISTGNQIVLITIIGVMTCISLVLGLKKGIKALSLINICVAIGLMTYVFLASNTTFILNSTVENVGNYLASFVPLSFDTYAFTNPDWFYGWTLFYWAWWIAFAAPTGLFIARISRGRTIREFVVGVLVIPVGFSFAWLTIFGNSALDLIHNQGVEELSAAVMTNSSSALFKFFELVSDWSLPSYLALFSIFVFFITTSDSGTLVINTLTSKDEDNAPISQRIGWVIAFSGITSLLLMSGGMTAIQSLLVIMGCPFAIMVTMMSYGFMKSVYIEVYSPATKTRGAELDEVIRKAEQTEIEYRKAQVIHGGK